MRNSRGRSDVVAWPLPYMDNAMHTDRTQCNSHQRQQCELMSSLGAIGVSDIWFRQVLCWGVCSRRSVNHALYYSHCVKTEYSQLIPPIIPLHVASFY